VGPMLVFTIASGPVLQLLFGAGFTVAAPLLPLVGLIGWALSLDNLLVQFFVALHDFSFAPILLGGCVLQAALIAVHHDSAGAIVLDVLAAMTGLLLVLGARVLLLIPRLHPVPSADADGRPIPGTRADKA